jgi:hypothetical protein
MIAGLFAVERQSAIEGDTAEQRLTRRTERSAPIVDKLRLWLGQQRATAPPRTSLGQALGYLHRQWGGGFFSSWAMGKSSSP